MSKSLFSRVSKSGTAGVKSPLISSNFLSPNSGNEDDSIQLKEIENPMRSVDDGNVDKPADQKVFDGYKYDIMIFVPNPNYKGADPPPPLEGDALTLEEILEKLNMLGLTTYAYQTYDTEEVIIKVGVHLDRLREFSEEIGYRLMFDEKRLALKDDQKNPIAENPGQQ